MQIKPSEVKPRDFYRILISAVAPRPIAWVSTISKDGVRNLAPYSFFNVVCGTPPMLGFSPGVRAKEIREALGSASKDTLQNIRDTGEFVVAVVTHELVERMNLTAQDCDASIDEFRLGGVTPRESALVKPAQVAESPVNFECQVRHILDLGSETSGSSLVIGEVVSATLADSVLVEGKIEGGLLDLVGRMGGNQYSRTTDRFDLARPPLLVPQK
jgi:flavin reductase (DIM6/NTAB) family NADH-FMN oxidoreductase RutF